MKIDGLKQVLIPTLLALTFALTAPCYAQPAADTGNTGSPAAASSEEFLGNTLEDFYSAALDYSPRLRIAAEQLNIGSARKRAATGRLLPQVNAAASLSENRRDTGGQIEEYPGERYSVQLSQVLFNWREFSARRQANYLEDQLEAEYYSELSNLLTEVAERYFDVLEAEDALESIRGELTAITTQVNQVQSYYDRQLAQITDLYEAQARLAGVQSQQLELQSQLELNREALRAVTGVTPGRIFHLDEETEIPVLQESIEYWMDQARVNSPLIQASQYARQAAEVQVSGTRGAYMPDVSLILQRQDSDVGFDNTTQPRVDNTYVGVNINVPLFAGGSNRAAVSEAISQQNIAADELRQVQLDVSQRTRTAYLQAKSTELRTEAARRLAESTALSAQASQQGFELGTVTTVDVLNALRDQYQAERDFQRTRYEHIKFLLILKRESGTLTANDLMDVGTWLSEPEN